MPKPCFIKEGLRCLEGNVALIVGKKVQVGFDAYFIVGSHGERNVITKGNALHYHAKLVVAALKPRNYVQREVELCVSVFGYLLHRRLLSIRQNPGLKLKQARHKHRSGLKIRTCLAAFFGVWQTALRINTAVVYHIRNRLSVMTAR